MKRALLLPGLGLVALTGCLTAAGPDYAPPTLVTPTTYSMAAALPQGTAETAAWWRGFGDAQLDALVQTALSENLDIAAAEARLAEARALLRVSRAGGGATLDGAANTAAEARFGDERRSRSLDSDEDVEGTADAGFLFSWAPDLFGGQRREVEAAEAELRRRALLRDDLARTTAAEVVRRYLEIRRDETRLALIDASLELQRQTLALALQRAQAGIGARLDVSRAEAQLAATQALRGPIRQDLAAATAALAVLTGQAAGRRLAAGIGGIPRYAGGPEIGLPRDLLRARPDVQAAEATLARTSAEIGIAEAELYPQLTIPGALTVSATGLGTSSVIEELIATLSARLAIPLFDSGGRRAEVAAAEARAQEALLLYRGALLDAVAETETALAGLIATRRQRADLQAAVNAGNDALAHARQLYAQGLVGFLDVLDAARSLLDNRQNLALADGDVALSIADLYSAVGAPTAAAK